jgi:hypothetical protein
MFITLSSAKIDWKTKGRSVKRNTDCMSFCMIYDNIFLPTLFVYNHDENEVANRATIKLSCQTGTSSCQEVCLFHNIQKTFLIIRNASFRKLEHQFHRSKSKWKSISRTHDFAEVQHRGRQPRIVVDSLSYTNEVTHSTNQLVPIVTTERSFVLENIHIRNKYFDTTPYQFTLRINLDVRFL